MLDVGDTCYSVNNVLYGEEVQTCECLQPPTNLGTLGCCVHLISVTVGEQFHNV